MVEVMESHTPRLGEWLRQKTSDSVLGSLSHLEFPILSNQLPSFMNSLLFSFSPCEERLNSLTNKHA